MSSRTPWHFIPMVFVTLIAAAVTVIDYLLVKLEVEAYLGLFSAEQVAFFTDLPLSIDILWGIAVWVGALGAVRMLGRRRGVAIMLGLSAVATLMVNGWIAVAAQPNVLALLGLTGIAILVGGTVLLLMLWSYARALHARGVLP